MAATILELSWSEAQPKDDSWDETYFDGQRAKLQQLHAAGLQVVLNTGVQAPPSWALALPGARYVDQYGHASGDQAGLNIVWNTSLRPLAAAYFDKVFQELGNDFIDVRVGAGELGELTYPRTVANSNSSSGAGSSYWAFDAAAASSNPVPGWRPGQASTAGQAETFLNWYLDTLARFQNWQIETVRRHFGGSIAVLYPDIGLQPGDFRAALATNLNGSSPGERTGKLQAGQDHQRLIDALTDSNVVAWCTWANNPAALGPIATAAHSKGLAVAGENSGDDTTLADLESLAANVHNFNLKLVIWVRYADLVSGSPGRATLADYRRISTKSIATSAK